MGIFDWLRGTPTYEGEPAFFVPEADFARTLTPPAQPVHDAPPAICDRCRRPLEEVVVTSRGPSIDDAVWDAAPVAVDGWVCRRCGTLRYPRPSTPERITAWGRRAADLARQNRPWDAEWWLVRMTWTWPHYPPGYLDLGQALLARCCDRDRQHEAPARGRLRRRAREAYETAIALETRDPSSLAARVLSYAHVALAEMAIEDHEVERAERAIAECLAIPGIDDATRERARRLERYVAERRWIFTDAAKVVEPYVDLDDRSPPPVDHPEVRKRVAQAVEALEAHYDEIPTHWQSVWMAAKGRAALGERERSLGLWRRAWRAHPDVADIVREHSLALLRAGLSEEARDVNRDATARMPDDAKLWCNRGVTEVLTGDLAEARRCVAESRALDPADPIARALEKRLSELDARALPRTLADLERRR